MLRRLAVIAVLAVLMTMVVRGQSLPQITEKAEKGCNNEGDFNYITNRKTMQDYWEARVFSIHADDFSAEWRWNVLRGYASRSIAIPAGLKGRQICRIYLLGLGIVLQEILCHSADSRHTN